jgi:hypothetical protein
MKLERSENRRTVAIAAYRNQHFLGYAIKGREGWIAVAALGMSWSKWKCQNIVDAQTWLRTTSHAARFDWFSEIADLQKLFDKLPDYQKPGITLESLGEAAMTPLRLSSVPTVQFNPN